MPIISYLKRVIYGELVVLDEAINVIIPEIETSVPDTQNPHNTVSQRLAQMRARGSKFACYCCKILTWIQNKIFRSPGDHCSQAIEGFPDDLPTGG